MQMLHRLLLDIFDRPRKYRWAPRNATRNGIRHAPQHSADRLRETRLRYRPRVGAWTKSMFPEFPKPQTAPIGQRPFRCARQRLDRCWALPEYPAEPC